MKARTFTSRFEMCRSLRSVCVPLLLIPHWHYFACGQLLTVAEPNEVLVKLNATGICHSDLHFMLNDWALPKMSELGTQCAGHEGAGVIVKVGSEVKTLKPGMRAGLKVHRLLPSPRSLRIR
jgi:hypothetical protein